MPFAAHHSQASSKPPGNASWTSSPLSVKTAPPHAPSRSLAFVSFAILTRPTPASTLIVQLA